MSNQLRVLCKIHVKSLVKKRHKAGISPGEKPEDIYAMRPAEFCFTRCR